METHILSKDEVYAIIKGKPLAYIQEPKFKKNFPNIYNDVLKWSFPEGFSWTQKLYHYFNDDRGFNLGKCECGNRCTFHSFSFVLLFFFLNRLFLIVICANKWERTFQYFLLKHLKHL